MRGTIYLFVVLIVCLIFTATTVFQMFTLAHAQTLSCYNGVVMPTSPSKRLLPAILIHGYFEDSSVWSNWEPLLHEDGIPYCTASFIQSNDPTYDSCGSAADHADELSQIVQKVKDFTGENQVNIVGHSKGGLDARVYLAQSGTPDVANLIMIGTPNNGDTLADYVVSMIYPYYVDFSNLFCRPALYDLETSAKDINAAQNIHTKYYTIYGDWNPSLVANCPQVPNSLGINWPVLEAEGWSNLQTPNDGIVPKSSVESLPNYTNHTNLGDTTVYDCHTNLLSKQEYDLAKTILNPLG
jgi:pimeloyl-ACP methyl ester carboxylesterase